MLATLSIRDVVLIEKLDLAFGDGLTVLTGETGAGKSILLDSLSLAIGARADSALVRKGADRGTVTAAFEVAADHPALAVLRDQDMEIEEDHLVLRRVVQADGRSRAYVNDQPVSVATLRAVGDLLVEIHGQFESHSLLNPATHRPVLDAHGALGPDLEATATACRTWKQARDAHAEAAAALDRARAEEDYLRHAVAELSALAPEAGEEDSLAASRAVMMHTEKLLEALNGAMADLTSRADVEAALRSAQRQLERVAEHAEGRLDPATAALERAAVEVNEAVAELERASSSVEVDPGELERTEERLFALRDMARKHHTEVDALPALLESKEAELAAVDQGTDRIAALARAEAEARDAYLDTARSLSRKRKAAGEALDAAVQAELPPLKLDRAGFMTVVEDLPETQWGEYGIDRVEFRVATNPGAAPGPLQKVASGGELARFMLALKVLLAASSPVSTLVFDEVDTGIGGATAHAVGERLGRLGAEEQVLVVTHSPQVAARGVHHLTVEKAEADEGMATRVRPLTGEERREELARMLSGATITDEARAAARTLLDGGSA